LTIGLRQETQDYKPMQKEKIIVKLHALDWTMGEVAFFYFTLSDIGRLKVEWGDGHTSHYHGKEIRAEHSYHSSAKKTGEPFKVIIECEDCTFKYFHTGCFDMAIDNVDFRESPSLETLESHGAHADLSPLKELKHFWYHESSGTTLDLNSNTQLETLDCSCGEMQSLLLSKCDNLKTLECWCCHNLRRITLSNASQLSKIVISPDHCVEPKCWEHIQKTIQKNNGTIEFI